MVSMVDTREILERLEEQQRQEKRKKIKEWLKMTYKDLQNLIKMVKNSGLKDIKLVDLQKVLRG